MEETVFDDEITEESSPRKRAIRAVVGKSLWTLLVIGGLLGLLLPLTIHLHWWKVPLACLLGLLTGMVITLGVMASDQNKALITTLLGTTLLPGLAVYLSLMATRGADPFEAASAVMTPFVLYAVAGFAGGRISAGIWRKRPDTAGGQAADRTAPHGPQGSQTSDSGKEHEA
jgi:hypothetical protein